VVFKDSPASGDPVSLLFLKNTLAGRGLQPRPKRLKDEDMAVVIENGRDRGATPVQLDVALLKECKLCLLGRCLTTTRGELFYRKSN